MIRRHDRSWRAWMLSCVALVLSPAALAADPLPDTARLGPPMMVMSPPLPPSTKPSRAAAVAPAKRPAAPPRRPATGAGKPLIPPATMPVKLDAAPKPRGSLPLATELQPLNPYEAPRPDRDLPPAKSPAG
jgi:hypothetical protein